MEVAAAAARGRSEQWRPGRGGPLSRTETARARCRLLFSAGRSCASSCRASQTLRLLLEPRCRACSSATRPSRASCSRRPASGPASPRTRASGRAEAEFAERSGQLRWRRSGRSVAPDWCLRLRGNRALERAALVGARDGGAGAGGGPGEPRGLVRARPGRRRPWPPASLQLARAVAELAGRCTHRARLWPRGGRGVR